MKNFVVFWEVDFFDHDGSEIYLVKEKMSANDLDSLLEQLDEGIENDEFTPEQAIENNFDLGNVNIEYALIEDCDGNVLYEDKDVDRSKAKKTLEL